MTLLDHATTRLAHRVFGGCVSMRWHAGLIGVYAPTDPSVWRDTASATCEELRAKLEGMEPRQIRFSPDRSWVESERVSAKVQESRQRGSRNGARPRAAEKVGE